MTREFATLPLVEADGAEVLLSMVRADGFTLSAILSPAEIVALQRMPSRLTPKRWLQVNNSEY